MNAIEIKEEALKILHRLPSLDGKDSRMKYLEEALQTVFLRGMNEGRKDMLDRTYKKCCGGFEHG